MAGDGDRSVSGACVRARVVEVTSDLSLQQNRESSSLKVCPQALSRSNAPRLPVGPNDHQGKRRLPGNIEVFVALHVERHEACLQAGIVEAPAFVVFLAVGTQARIFPSVARLPGSKPHGARHDADLRSTPFLYTSGVHCTRRPHITSSESMKQDRCYCSFLRRYWSQEF